MQPTDSGQIVAVTGASGFVGRNLVDHLARTGCEVRAVTRHPAPFGESDAIVVKPIGDYSSVADLREAIEGSGCIVHLADAADRRSYKPGNVDRARSVAAALIDAMNASRISRIIVASSVHAGRAGTGRSSLYGESKRRIEQEFISRAAPELNPVILRLPPIYGPGSRGSFDKLARAVRHGLPLPFADVAGAGRYLALGNLLDLCTHLISADAGLWNAARGRIYQPADAKPVGLAELIRTIAEVEGRAPRLFAAPLVRRLLDRRATRPVPGEGGTTGSLLRDFGWSPPVGLREGLGYLRAIGHRGRNG